MVLKNGLQKYGNIEQGTRNIEQGSELGEIDQFWFFPCAQKEKKLSITVNKHWFRLVMLLAFTKDSMGEKYNLDERLITFAALIIEIAESLPQTFAGKHVGGQLIRSGTAPALHYGEAQGGESRSDFIHKMKIGLKELRETYNALRIIKKVNWLPLGKLDVALDENNQLISIFVKSIATAQKNNSKANKRMAI